MLTFFFVLWIILNGRITLELVLLGIPIAAAVFLFARAAFGYSASTELSVLKAVPLAFLYVLNLIREILLSALHVIALVLSPTRKPQPVLIEFDSGLPTQIQNVILANSITLTPGTVTVEMSEGHFLVHCLLPEYAQGIEDSSFVKLLRLIRT